ncbi:GAF domain-containing protein [Sulfitobacter sp. JBTF-M27]|uniref:GAF domain-containing protein n=1 Tax=Sulfitobacter sediminilitoris TaxID=2698830 RepID=A0A6P0CIM2_9RHOB|nr:adenylate/guanylate cyclase domain-containing protein [Sulfitobacter sediminilitoris]NEK24946.1 GAF domain-containing protein [Sulfitobacter sediminilitoris]
MQDRTTEDENVSLRAEVDRLREQEAASREILAVISQNRHDEQPVLDAITQNSVKLCDAAGAGLWLLNSAGDATRLASIAQNQDQKGEALVSVGLEFPRENVSAMGQCYRDSRTMNIADNRDDPYYLNGDPTAKKLVDKVGMRSRLIVPLLENGIAFGCISLHRKEVRAFSDEEVTLIESFGRQAVIAIENVRQFKALEILNDELSERVSEQVGEIERVGRLKRFLPAAVAETVISQGADKMLSSHRALLGVLFCDIRGFTAFCETAEPEETIEVLQTYHEEMGKLINAHSAGVDHRMGDGIMVLFNDPLPCDDPAGDAVRLALAMRARMAEFAKKWKRLGYKLGFGVGISLGYATVGLVGFEGRFDYTASGTAINLASRLCDEAQDGEILLSPKAAIAIEDLFRIESRGELSLKGLREPLEIFRLIGGATS